MQGCTTGLDPRLWYKSVELLEQKQKYFGEGASGTLVVVGGIRILGKGGGGGRRGGIRVFLGGGRGSGVLLILWGGVSGFLLKGGTLGCQGHPNIQHSTLVGTEGWHTMR